MPDIRPENQLRRWQRRLDEDFPDGLLASWEDPGGPVFTYPVPRVEVVAIRGLDPQVLLPVPDWGKTVAGVVVSYTEIQSEPCRVVRVIFADYPRRPMLWSAGTGALKHRLVPLRDKLIRLADARGCSSFAPPPGDQP